MTQHDRWLAVWVVLAMAWACGAVWDGYWVSTAGQPLYMESCMDMSNEWSAVMKNRDGETVLRFTGSLQDFPSGPKVIGNCTGPRTPPQVDFNLIGWNSLGYIFPGTTIHFLSSTVTEPFNLTLSNYTGSIITQFSDIPPGTPLSYTIDPSLVDSFNLIAYNWIFVTWGTESGWIELSLFGDSLEVESMEDPKEGMHLSLQCWANDVPYLNHIFLPVSGTISNQCGDNSRLWIGSWQIEVSSPQLYLGNWWFVCESSSGGLVSSFSDPETIAHAGGMYYISESIEIGFYEVRGELVLNQDRNSRGQFHFEMSDATTFSGVVEYEGNTYGVSGSLSGSTPYRYLCSPLDVYGGLWVESQYSSWLNLCVDNNAAYGSYLGGSILVNGTFTYNGNWFLNLDTYNTRTTQTDSYYLTMDRSTHQKPIVRVDTRQATVFARSDLRTITNCRAIPSTWGTFYDELFSSEMYLCTSDGNTVYGSMNNGFYTFVGNLTDVNVISGKIKNTDLEFVWKLESNRISAEYKDKNDVSISSSMTKRSEDVTLSQCNSLVLISGYTGAWVADGGSVMHFCQISDTEIEGRMDNYHFYGVYKDSILTGTYVTKDGTSGNWNARTDKAEKAIFVTIGGTSMSGRRTSRVSSPDQCGAWRTFWKTSFGTSDLTHLLGGCFSVCFNSRTEFSIIFFNTELYGTGTMDIMTGKLSGNLQNGLHFGISIGSTESVNVNVQDNHGQDITSAYVLCSSLPTNYSTTDYHDCRPRRFEPTVQLPTTPFPKLLNFHRSQYRKGGVDITANGKMAIVASGNTTFVMENSAGVWEKKFQFILPEPSPFALNEFPYCGGNPVAITDTHAFVITELEVNVFQIKSGAYEWMGSLAPPYPDSRPYYVTKTFSEGFSVLEVTWRGDIFYLSLYNITQGLVDMKAFANLPIVNELVLSVAIHPSWLVYSSFDYEVTLQLKVYYCPLSQNGLSSCSHMKLTTLSSINDIFTFGLGFSVAVNSNYLFVGHSAAQNNNGTVYVYKNGNGIWRLSQVLYPPDTGLHQSFGRTIFARDDHLMVLKAQDNTLRPFSMALFSYTLSSSNMWTPKYKFVSEDWPAFVPPSYKKRQYFYPPLVPLESVLYWSMSNNGQLFTTGESLDSFVQTAYDCAPGFWGKNCSLRCPCAASSTCNSFIIEYTCTCLPNTYGVNCENTCKNCHGALCDDGSTGSGVCLCNSSQYGPECLPCSCLNGGICSSGPNGTGSCNCLGGYSGEFCETKVESPVALTIALSIVLPFLAFTMVGIILFFLCRKEQVLFNLSDVPVELQLFFDVARIKSEEGWKEEKGFMAKNVKDDKRYLQKLKALMDQLDGSAIEWSNALAIFNPTLQSNFLGYRNVILDRHKDSPASYKHHYQSIEKRDWVMEQYNALVDKYEWNSQLELPIIPVIHGTSSTVAKSICANGFAVLSSEDSGYYGKGIYTTSSCLYALPQYATKPKPTILICLITPGNVSPIIEDPTEQSNWIGKLIPEGFQCHYVVTAKNGKVIQKREEKFFDEFVLPTENQLVPIYMLTVDISSVQAFLLEYQREIPTNNTELKTYQIV